MSNPAFIAELAFQVEEVMRSRAVSEKMQQKHYLNDPTAPLVRPLIGGRLDSLSDVAPTASSILSSLANLVGLSARVAGMTDSLERNLMGKVARPCRAEGPSSAGSDADFLHLLQAAVEVIEGELHTARERLDGMMAVTEVGIPMGGCGGSLLSAGQPLPSAAMRR